MLKLSFLVLLFLLFVPSILSGQKGGGVVEGHITDEKNNSLDLVTVSVKGSGKGTVSGEGGKYSINLKAEESYLLVFSRLGFESKEISVRLNSGETKIINQSLSQSHEKIDEIVVIEGNGRDKNAVRIDPKLLNSVPQISGGAVEGLVKTLPGVSSNNELSSQYSVRGGNFDENLVYVNNIEIYRPFLVRSGRQEGLSFVNSDMVSSIDFSAGGFSAEYGDKMSSVLDIKYRVPEKTSAYAEVSMLGASVRFEGTAFNKRLTHNSGFRYKTNRYLLGTLDETGDYTPSYLDFQTYITYKLSDKVSLGFLGNIASNEYQFVPETRLTQYGTWAKAYQFMVYFDGGEHDKYNTLQGAASLDIKPSDNVELNFIVSGFRSEEREKFDITGQYLLNELDVIPGAKGMVDSSMNVGIGGFHDHARNKLDARVVSFQHLATVKGDNNIFQWGAKFQHEVFDDFVSEWEVLDSSGYSLPYNDAEVELFRSVKAENHLRNNRISGFIQDSWLLPAGRGSFHFTGGFRGQYWSFNKQVIFSPRLSTKWKPNSDKNYSFRLAWGVYNQMPFFKELKNSEAEIIDDVEAQKSTHYLLGYDHYLTIWNRPFKFTSEAYYKDLSNLIPYKVDNVYLRYFPEQTSTGYSCGIDFKIYGEFVKGAQSWAGFSIMKTEEVIIGDKQGNISPGYIPRPSDQRFNFNLFFQDYFPGYPKIRMYLTLLYGSRLPFGPPYKDRWADVFRMPSYRRVDIGFSREFVDYNPDKVLKSTKVSVEIFNLLDINNTISYFWVPDISNQLHAVPNYLTGRRFNLKISTKF
jgi:hypothetical protein